MVRPDPRTLPAAPSSQIPASGFDDSMAWDDDADPEGNTLLRLVGAAALAILALAAASLMLV